MTIQAIITGATGMVGEGVLHECLLDSNVTSVLVINRKPCGIKHPKLKEILHKDFHDLSPIKDQLSGFNACYFCLGISSVGVNAKKYKSITYDLTMHVAETLLQLNPNMVFCYVSGAGTDGTEKGNSRWARLKGKVENDLMKMSFKDAYMFRPGYIQPTKGLNNTYTFYKIFAPIYPVLKKLFPKYVVTMEELGKAMIHVTKNGFKVQVLECLDIVQASGHKV